MAEEKTVITLICERAAEVDSVMTDDKLKDQPNVKVIKFPCSGMIQPLMVEAAIKAGASGVVVCGCQIGDCYYREGNKMIKERLLGGRPPGLKKFVDRRRVLALWLSRKQTERFLSETKDFVSYVKSLDGEEKSKVAEAKPSNAPAAKKEEKPKEAPKAKSEDKKADDKGKSEGKAKGEEKKSSNEAKSGDKEKKPEDKKDKDDRKEDK